MKLVREGDLGIIVCYLNHQYTIFQLTKVLALSVAKKIKNLDNDH